VGFDGSGFSVLFSHDGDIYAPGISSDGRYAVIQFSSVEQGNRTDLVDLRSRQGFSIASIEPRPAERTPRPFTAQAADGVTRLHGTMFFPSYFEKGQRYPLIDCIYPGPHSSQQPQSYCAMSSARARSLAELGFITIMLDQRGAPVASRAFHQAGYGSLLEPQLADHAAVVRQLCERHEFIDRDRIGIIGESAGGAAAARALFDYGDVFNAGVSVCGPHDPRFYTSMWSDKYRGPIHADTPAEPPNTALAHKLRGKLFLISGDMDENVHVSHTLALADALIRVHKDFELLIVPNEGHNVLFTSGYALRRAWDFFVRHLRDESPPADFELQFEPHELARAVARVMREFR
jgi:dipeptidyl aminopeptidase/acylaminoacyl peptidase